MFQRIIIRENDRELAVQINVSTRAKRISIKIGADKKPILVIPKAASLEKAKLFLEEHKSWVFTKTFFKDPDNEIKTNNKISVLGNEYNIVHCSTTPGTPRFDDNRLILPEEGLPYKLRLNTILDKMLMREVRQYIDEISPKIGKAPTKISLRDSKTRWGSCSSRGTITLSRRLVFAPIHVVQYVVLHELCHLLEHNHSKKFWDLVKLHRHDYKLAELWLKINSKDLYLL